MREWHPVGAEEYGYVAADPNDPDVVYGGKLTRYDRRTGQAQDIMPPRGPNFRVLRTAPVLFAPMDPKTLFFASNTLWKTTTGGQTWTELSPDLSRETWDVPASVGSYRGTPAAAVTRRGVIYTVAPSPIDNSVVWAGTDDGLIHITRDAGKTWTNVTPSALTPWAKVSLIEASHFDPNTAHAHDQHTPPRRSAAARVSHARRRAELARDRQACRRAPSSIPCAKTRCVAACSSRAPNARSSCRSTTASWQPLS
jgi:hypothetical protein